MWKRCWAWSEGNPAPHFHDVSKWLESLITGSLHQQWHCEVSSLEPLCHLLITERTWNHINQHTLWGRGSKARFSMLGTRSWLRSHSAQHLVLLSASPTHGDSSHPRLKCPCTSPQGLQHCPTGSAKVHDLLSPCLALQALGWKPSCHKWCGAWPSSSSSSTHCFRLTAAAASTLELSSTCWLTALKPKVLRSQLHCTDN